MNRKQELSRLRSKAGVASLDPGCPECKEDGHEVAEVYWDADGETYEGPEFCLACGRRLIIDVSWPDVERGPE